MTTQIPLILEPIQLQEILSQENLLIVDLSSPENFNRGHIPGSVHLAFSELMGQVPPAMGKVPSIEHITQLLNGLGITQDTHIIALDDEGGGWAGRFLWTLHLVGLRKYSYLNGGLVAWVNEGHPLSAELKELTPAQESYVFDSNELIEAETLIKSFSSESPLQVWDARSPAEYTGQQVTAARAGHMPGAVNINWTDTMDPQRNLRIRDDIKTFLNDCGLKLDQPTITHCQSHHRSGLTWLIGKYLNIDIRGYHGSWSEWGNRNDTQVEI